MAKRRMGIIGLLIYVCLCLIPCNAHAASTADAKEMIQPERPCTITVSYVYNGTAFSDLSVKLYKIADVSADFQYTPTTRFQSTGLRLNGVQSAGEWNVIRSTLEAHIIANAIVANDTAATDRTGQVSFESLMPGLYLAIPGTGIANSVQCTFESTLVSLPGLGTDGLWQYQISSTAKGVPLPPADADEEISLKILKLWKGDSNTSKRPKEIEVEIFRNGKHYQTITLSENNHWSYSWTVKDDGSEWMVAERNVPSGYTATLKKQDTSFVLTNTLVPNTPPSGTEGPKTGDTSNIMLYMLLMYTSGILLVILGITGKKKRV